MIGQSVAIYRNRRTGEYRIQPCARAGGVPQEFGPQVILPAHTTDGQLLTLVLENLSKTDRQQYVPSQAPSYPPEEHRRMLKEDQLINVRQGEREYRLIPFKKMRNSFGSIDELIKIIPVDQFLVKGGELIRQMFEEIS